MIACATSEDLRAAYGRRMAELRSANVGPLDLFTDPALDALDAAMRADETRGGLDDGPDQATVRPGHSG